MHMSNDAICKKNYVYDNKLITELCLTHFLVVFKSTHLWLMKLRMFWDLSQIPDFKFT